LSGSVGKFRDAAQQWELSAAPRAQSLLLPGTVRDCANGAPDNDGGYDRPGSSDNDNRTPARVIAGMPVAVVDAAQNEPNQAADCVSLEPLHGEISPALALVARPVSSVHHLCSLEDGSSEAKPIA
jgi:hypothetical protein